MHICEFLFRCLYYRQLIDIFYNNRAPYSGLVALTDKTQEAKHKAQTPAYQFLLPAKPDDCFFLHCPQVCGSIFHGSNNECMRATISIQISL